MSDFPLLIIGGGLSGLAAGIRFARFGQRVLILERHSRPGGLNSFYYRDGRLLETGLHAITNYARPDQKQAPLNRLLRQLKISRDQFTCREQMTSEILFPGQASLTFSNDFSLLRENIANSFPGALKQFDDLVRVIDDYDAFTPRSRTPTRRRLEEALGSELLADMLLCPLLFYGGCEEEDIDFSQFVIMFRAIFQEGFFRPAGTIKELLNLLLERFRGYGGEIRFKTEVSRIIDKVDDDIPMVRGVELSSGEIVTCNFLLSTIGYPETARLLGPKNNRLDNYPPPPLPGRLSFMESIYFLRRAAAADLVQDRTIIFYNRGTRFYYGRPAKAVDLDSGVICFPDNFHGLPVGETFQLRVTHMANYDLWRQAYESSDQQLYGAMKQQWAESSRQIIGDLIGNFAQNIVYEDTFTPITIERYTARMQGAVYGSPVKLKDGRTDRANLFLAGTDQGFLGIVGSMLSGVSMVNAHILNKV